MPEFAGGAWNMVPGGVGRCGGWFAATEPTTAAGWPAISTLLTSPELIVPLNGCGSGVGTGPPGEGTMTMWVSTPTTVAAPFAAGWPISSPTLAGRTS